MLVRTLGILSYDIYGSFTPLNVRPMEYLPREMRSLFLWGEDYSIGAKTIYLGCDLHNQQDDIYLREPMMVKIALLDSYRF